MMKQAVEVVPRSGVKFSEKSFEKIKSTDTPNFDWLIDQIYSSEHANEVLLYLISIFEKDGLR